MAHDGPQYTHISKKLAHRMPTRDVPEANVADAIRNTLYAAREAGILEPVTEIMRAQAEGDVVALDLIDSLTPEV